MTHHELQHAVTISFRQIAQNKQQQGQTLVVDTWSSESLYPNQDSEKIAAILINSIQLSEVVN